jgi:hypothetical protein
MTLNSFVNIYRNLVIDHKQLQSFFVGNPDQFFDLKSRVYPALIMTLNPSTVTEFTTDFKAQFMVLDKPTSEGREDLLRVQSLTHSIIKDVIAVTNEASTADPISIDINISDSDLMFVDKVAGCFCDLTLQTFEQVTTCYLPITTGFFLLNEDGTFVLNENGTKIKL